MGKVISVFLAPAAVSPSPYPSQSPTTGSKGQRKHFAHITNTRLIIIAELTPHLTASRPAIPFNSYHNTAVHSAGVQVPRCGASVMSSLGGRAALPSPRPAPRGLQRAGRAHIFCFGRSHLTAMSHIETEDTLGMGSNPPVADITTRSQQPECAVNTDRHVNCPLYCFPLVGYTGAHIGRGALRPFHLLLCHPSSRKKSGT